MRDYACLSRYHYRAKRPATTSRVLVATQDVESIGSRYHRCLVGTQNPSATREICSPSDRRVLAVLVESLPTLRCRARDVALEQRYGAVRNLRERAAMLQRELRCISRVVVHPQWRGVGLAHRLVCYALDHAETRYTEAIAAMGRVNPFFLRAGMTAHPQPIHKDDARLLGALRYVGIEPVELVDVSAVARRIAMCEASREAFIRRELARWAKRFFALRSGEAMGIDRCLAAARDRLLCHPLYFLHDNGGARGSTDAPIAD